MSERFWIQVANHEHDAEIIIFWSNIRAKFLSSFAMRMNKKCTFTGLFCNKRRKLTRIFKSNNYENDLSLKINENKRILTLNMV